MSKPFIQYIKGEEALDMLEHYGNAYLLFSLIVQRAARLKTKVLGLEPNQALVGDHKKCSLTEQSYRTAKKQLEKLGFVTFKATSKGTIATIVNTSVFDINCANTQLTGSQQAANAQVTDKVTGKELSKHTVNTTITDTQEDYANGQANSNLTASQQAANAQVTTNKEVITNKEVSSESEIPFKDQKETEEKNSDKKIPTLAEFMEHGLSRRPDVSKEDLRMKYYNWIDGGWLDGKGQEIKVWRLKLNHTLKYMDKETEQVKFVPPTWREAANIFYRLSKDKKYSEVSGIKFVNHHESNNWKRKGEQIFKWEGLVQNWYLDDQAKTVKNGTDTKPRLSIDTATETATSAG